MENYPALTGKTQMAQMTSKDMREIKRTAPELKKSATGTVVLLIIWVKKIMLFPLCGAPKEFN